VGLCASAADASLFSVASVVEKFSRMANALTSPSARLDSVLRKASA